MATVQELRDQIRAERLRNEIRAARQQQTQPQPPPAPERRRIEDEPMDPPPESWQDYMTPDQRLLTGAMSGVNRTLLRDLPDFVANTLPRVANWAGETTGLWDTKAAEVSVPDALRDFVAAGSEPVSDAPADKAAYTFGRWAAPAPIKGAQVLTKADVGMGAGAAGGEALADRLGTSEGTSELLEIAGGLAGALRGSAAAPSHLGTARTPSFVGDFGDYRPITEPEKWDINAAKAIAASAENPEAAMRTLARSVEAGDTGTLSQMTGDLGIAGLEKTVPQGARTLEDMRGLRQAREEALVGRMQQTGSQASPVEGTRAAQSRLRKVRDRLAQQRTGAVTRAETAAEPGINATVAAEADAGSRLAKARAQAQEARIAADMAGGEAARARAAATEGALPPARASEQLAGAVEDSAQARRAGIERPAWEALEAAPREAMQPVYNEVNETLLGIKQKNPQAYRKLSEKYGSQIRDFNKLGKEATPAEVNILLSDIKAELRAKKKSITGDAYGTAEKHLDDVVQSIDRYMRNESPSAGLFRAATAETAEGKTRFASGQVGRARDVEPELMAQKWGTKGNEGAVTLREMERINDPDVRSAMIDRVMSEAAQSPDLNKFIAEREQFLTGFPAVRQRLESALDADTGAMNALERAKYMETRAADVGTEAAQSVKGSTNERARLVKSVEKAEKEAVERFERLSNTLAKKDLGAYASRPGKTLEKILNDGDKGPERLGSLMAKTGRSEGVKAAARDQFLAKVTPKRTDKATITGSSMDHFLRMRPTMEASGAMTTKELDDIAANLMKGLDDNRLLDAAVSMAPSRVASEIDNLVASGLAAAVSPSFSSQQSLMLNGAVRRVFRRALADRKQAPALVKHIDQFILDPAKMQGLEKYMIPKLAQDMNPKDIARVGADTAAYILRSFKPLAIASDEED